MSSMKPIKETIIEDEGTVDLDVNELEERTHKIQYMIDGEATDFYNRPDCAYIRIQYIPEGEGLKFQVRNELFYTYTPENIPEGCNKLATFLRGLVETALVYPHNIYQMGLEAQNHDILDHNNMNTDQRDLLKGTPMGNA